LSLIKGHPRIYYLTFITPISEEDKSASEGLTNSGEEGITSKESNHESRNKAEPMVRRDNCGTESESPIADK